MTDPIVESHIAESAHAAAILKESEQKVQEVQIQAAVQVAFDTAKPKWMAHHEEDDATHFREINERLDKLPDEIHKVIIKSLLTGGGRVRTGIIVTATIIGSLLVIFGGMKTLLGWLGFTYLTK